VISARALSKHFGQLHAVDNLNLEVARGEFFAFLGPNAAGKTTTIRMLTGLLRPSAGEVRIGGFDMHREPEKAKALLAYVPDFPFLYEKLTATEFMQFVGDVFRVDRAAIESRTGDLFERFHLTDYRHELTENLSHGTRQRLVIASALLHNPEVFIIDEPMVGLDPMHARIVKQEFRDRSRAGMTMFLSTHQLSVAEEVADRIGIIHHGRLIALGTVDELRRQSGEGGALEKVFLSLIDAEEAQREKRQTTALPTPAPIPR
jgi:ABC-2 type transport system ATP-binding protein